jgi:D-glycero-D-manno-heptose 1,7-bisphosphate phosphatase
VNGHAAKRRAVFLDRDGTLIEDVGFLGDPGGVVVLPTVVEALRLLAAHEYATIVISNQSGIARGLLDDERVRSVNAEIARRLAGDGLTIDGWYWCPHYDAGCACRKPEPGLLERAVDEHALTLAGGAMVGDRGSDIELGHRVGIPGILVPGPMSYEGPEPDLRARTLLEAAEWIVRRGG